MARRHPWILLALPLVGCGRPVEPARIDLILITLDTTRADVLEPGPERARLAPALDRLAREGLSYARARTVAPLTLPAHASMMTGLYPPRSGVRGNAPMRLGESARTLAEAARENGYQTAAFVAALALDRAYGLEQGFEVYDQPASTGGREVGQISERPASAVVDAALGWLERRDATRPLLLWLHVFDPHAPYSPGAAALARARGDAYRGEVAEADAALGRLFDVLRKSGALERTFVAVIGDHGEALGEHGEPTHGLLCYDGTLRVPFFLRYPDGFRAGEISQELVSVVDVHGTLLEAMGLAPPQDSDGLSLFRRSVPAERGLYFESYEGWRMHGWSPLVGWIDGAAKYIHSSRPELASAEVVEGPGAAWDVEEAMARPYLRAIEGVLARPRLVPPEPAGLGEERRRELAALGYASSEHGAAGLPDALQSGSLLNPVERVGDAVQLELAVEQLRAGDLPRAAASLERLAQRNPASILVHDQLVRCRMAMGDWERALEVLERRLQLPPESISTHRDLASCLRALGRADEAEAHVRRSLELLIEWSELRGDREAAEGYRRILREAPQSGS
jgi:hypothetical protein